MTSSSETLLDRARTEHTPLIVGDQATFVWAGERAPVLAGDMTGWQPWETSADGRTMTEVESGVWACTLTLPDDAYVEYIYFLDGQRMSDPFNPHRVPNGFGDSNNCFWMPQATRSLLYRRQKGVRPGKVSKRAFQSIRLAEGRRMVWLYRSAAEGPYPLLLCAPVRWTSGISLATQGMSSCATNPTSASLHPYSAKRDLRALSRKTIANGAIDPE